VKATWEAVQGAIAPVLADLERTRPGCVRLERVDGEEGIVAWLYDSETDSGTGLWLGAEADPLEAVFDMASCVQEVAMEVLWRAWPECPQHPNGHPLELDEADGAAVWVCPETGNTIATVGELSERAESN
jgi:hypothetical protein